jgi:hypothetical protein
VDLKSIVLIKETCVDDREDDLGSGKEGDAGYTS